MNAPAGTIILWKLSEIPDGWSIFTIAEGKFLRGVPDGGSAGVTGGVSSHTHTPGAVGIEGSHIHSSKSFSYGYSGNTSAVSAGTGTQDTSLAVSHYHTATVALGSGGAHSHTFSSTTGGASNLPPHKVAIYIIKD